MASCNETVTFQCLSWNVIVVFVVLGGMLGISLFLNIYCCTLRCSSEKKACRRKTKKSQSSRQMADNPIYGNVSSARQVLYTEVDASHPLHKDRHRVNLNAQDCYANLTQTPHLQSGLSSSQTEATQYSDIVDVVEVEREKVEESITDDVSTMSDLYASVQTQRTKAILSADGEENYANHL